MAINRFMIMFTTRILYSCRIICTSLSLHLVSGHIELKDSPPPFFTCRREKKDKNEMTPFVKINMRRQTCMREREREYSTNRWINVPGECSFRFWLTKTSYLRGPYLIHSQVRATEGIVFQILSQTPRLSQTWTDILFISSLARKVFFFFLYKEK